MTYDAEYYRQYKIKNKESLEKKRKEYYNANKERINKQKKDWYRKNRERLLREKREYNKTNKKAIKDAKYKKVYGISLKQAREIWVSQNRRCAICEKKLNLKDIHVDHDHSSGIVRGILCSKCNLGLGQFCDNPNFLMRAAKYLEGDRCHE